MDGVGKVFFFSDFGHLREVSPGRCQQRCGQQIRLLQIVPPVQTSIKDCLCAPRTVSILLVSLRILSW